MWLLAHAGGLWCESREPVTWGCSAVVRYWAVECKEKEQPALAFSTLQGEKHRKCLKSKRWLLF